MALPESRPWLVQAVVFDLDGLLVDTEPIFEEAARRLLARRGLMSRREVLQAMLGIPARDALVVFRTQYQLTETVAELAAEASQLFYEVLGQEPAPLMPGALELLDRLERRGIPTGIATSSSARYAQRILEPHGLRPRFRFVLSCDDVEHGKPAPEIYLKAAAHFGRPAREMVVLEDSPNGLRAAKAAGARCVVVPHALVPLEDLAGADAVVSSLAAPELAELLTLL